MEYSLESPGASNEFSSLLGVLWALDDDVMAGVEVGAGVSVWASYGVVGLGTEALRVVGVKAMTGGDAEDGGCNEAGVRFNRTSNCRDRFAVIRCLTCYGGGVCDRGVLVFDGGCLIAPGPGLREFASELAAKLYRQLTRLQ